MRLLLFADLHLDTPFTWAAGDVARRRRQTLRDALARTVTLAGEVGADVLVSAGDLYEHERYAADTGAFLRQRFTEAPCPVLLVPGNHDWYGRESLYATVDWPDHVHVVTAERLEPTPLAGDATVWGVAHTAPAGAGDPFADVRADGQGPHVAVVHGSERSGMAHHGEGHHPHAPFDDPAVPAAGFAHALCGHYHRPREGPHHTYPGNPEPLTFGEDGRRGPVVVDVDADGAVRRRWCDVAGTTWHDPRLDVSGAATLDECRDRARELLAGLEGVARLTVAGELDPAVDLRPDRDLSLEALGLRGNGLEALVVRTGGLHVGYDLDDLAGRETVAGQFVRDVRADDRLDPAAREQVLAVGLRALAGRDDLEVG